MRALSRRDELARVTRFFPLHLHLGEKKKPSEEAFPPASQIIVPLGLRRRTKGRPPNKELGVDDEKLRNEEDSSRPRESANAHGARTQCPPSLWMTGSFSPLTLSHVSSLHPSMLYIYIYTPIYISVSRLPRIGPCPVLTGLRLRRVWMKVGRAAPSPDELERGSRIAGIRREDVRCC